MCVRQDPQSSPCFGSSGASQVTLVVENLPANAGDVRDIGSIPGFGTIPWKRERLPTPAFWPGDFHGLYSPLGHKELDMTE